jgi:hypothetical protein|tara:strand:- start:1022 stop:1171 length:150 start_codon:yes stop_codon:yes gene_type:complete
MLDDIVNVPIISYAPIKKKNKEKPKYTKSDAMRNLYKAKVSSITKKRGQ